jgi:hypothetical protein
LRASARAAAAAAQIEIIIAAARKIRDIGNSPSTRQHVAIGMAIPYDSYLDLIKEK